MTQELHLKPIGLALDINPHDAPDGSLLQASNCVIRKKGVLQSRPGFLDPTTGVWTAPAGYTVQSIIPYDGDALCFAINGSTWTSRWQSDGATVGAGETPPNTTERHIGYAEARGSLFYCTNGGVQKLTASTVDTPTRAGLQRARQGSPTTYDAGTTAKNWLAINYYASWRAVIRSEDANGYVRRSAPSGRMFLQNGASVRAVSLVIPTGGFAAGDVVELYRTRSSATAEPGEEYQLSTEYTLLAADISAGFATIYDNTPDDSLGASLYTNPGQQGDLQENGRPFYAHDVAEFHGSMFYARDKGTVPPQVITMVDPNRWTARPDGDVFTCTANVATGDATVSSITGITAGAASSEMGVGQLVTEAGQVAGAASTHLPWGAQVASVNAADSVELSANALANGTGISVQFSDVIDIDGNQFFAWTSESVANNCFRWLTVSAGSPDTVRQAAVSLCYVVNRQLSDLVVSLLSSGEDEAILLIEWVTAPTNYTYQMSNGRAWAPNSTALAYGGVQSSISVTVETFPGRLQWSKAQLPEAVPPVNFTDVGDALEPIYRIIVARDALWILKRDGIWRLTGSGPDAGWRVDPVSSARLLTPRACASLGDDVAVWLDTGVHVIGTGMTPIDAPMVSETLSDVARLIRAEATPYAGAFVRCNKLEGEVYVAVPASGTAQTCAAIYVYNANTGAWTTWAAPTQDLVLGEAGKLISAGTVGWGVGLERVGTLFDCADSSYTITIVDNMDGTYSDSTNTWVPVVGDRVARTIGDALASAFVLTVDGSAHFTLSADIGTGGATAYVAIETTVEWVAKSARSPQALKRWTEGSLAWESIFDAYEYTLGFKTDQTRNLTTTQTQNVARLLDPNATGVSGAAFDAIAQGYEQTAVMFYIPRAACLASQIRPRVTIRQGGVCWALTALSLTFEPISTKLRRHYGA